MKKLITKKDFILVIIVLVVGLAGIIFVNSTDKGKTAIIKVDGKDIETILLQNDTLIKVNGVTVCCENGEIFVEDSDCPDKVCVRSGKISKAGEGIICAPNRVAIEISGKSNNPLDALTG